MAGVSKVKWVDSRPYSHWNSAIIIMGGVSSYGVYSITYVCIMGQAGVFTHAMHSMSTG